MKKTLFILPLLFFSLFTHIKSPHKDFSISTLKPKFNLAFSQASSAQTLLDQVESLYELIEGTNAEDSSGLIDFINTVISNLGNGLYTAGHAHCDTIPVVGTEQVTDSEYTYNFVFEQGTKTIPSHFFIGQNSSTILENRIEVDADGNHFLTIEFTCNDSGYTTGYFRYYEFNAEEDRDSDNTIFDSTNADSLADSIHIETYFQYNGTRDQVEIDFYLTMETSNGRTRKLATQFETDSSEFKIWTIQYLDDANTESVEAVMVSGNRDDKLYSINRGIPTSDATDTTDEVTDWSENDCVDNSSGTPATSLVACGASSLAAANGHPIIVSGSNQNYTIQNVQNLELSSLGH